MSSINYDELKSAVESCKSEDAAGNCDDFAESHGEIGNWRVSKIKSMRRSKYSPYGAFFAFLLSITNFAIL